MAYRKYLLILFLLLACKASAQENTFLQADSISNAQYLAGNWQELLASGKQAIDAGNDFPALRLRMAYAFFSTQNYTAALQQYDHVLANDTYNSTARYYAYWCNRYLNRYQEANYNASFIDKKLLKDERMFSALIDAGVETSLKFPESNIRRDASFNRAFLENRFGWRIESTESVAYYNQSDNNQIYLNQQNPAFQIDRDQFEYYQKLSYSINSKWTVLGAYHFVHTNKPNHLALLGLKYTHITTEIQADVNYSYINNLRIYQYNAKLNWYPLGNLNFYTSTRAVFQQKANNEFIFSELAGGKILKDVWAEASATFGKQDNYLEADALYVYNVVDPTTFKTGATAYFQLNPHLLLPLSYMFERKNNVFRELDYNQHTITAAVIWRF